MNLLRKTTSFKKLFVIAFFLVLHVFLLNINVAEWGDSYRILRAAEFIKKGSYPSDEKRQPLFAALLAVRPANVEQVLWGRIEVFGLSVLSFFLFYKLLTHFVKEEKYQIIGLLLFTLNPVYLYWSIRVMTDILFTVFVVLVFLLFEKWKKNLSIWKCCVLGFAAGISVLTRFEGYLLVASVFAGILFGAEILTLNLFKPGNLFKLTKNSFSKLASYVLGVLIPVLPYLYFRNPLTSTYLEEPTNRKYDLQMIWIYLASLIFIFGFIPAFYYIFKGRKTIIDFVTAHAGISFFIFFELVLILLWPAAIPRLFMPIIPFLIIMLVLAYEHRSAAALSIKDLILMVSFFGLFAISQYFLKLQFLLTEKIFFVIILMVQLFSVFLIYFKRVHLFYTLSFLSVFLWALLVIWVHKDIFISVKNAAEYASHNVDGVVGYNDVSSVSDWYLNNASTTRHISGFYYYSETKANLTYPALVRAGLDYLLITNEHNTTMSLDLEKRPYLTIIKQFRYNVNGKNFFAELVKFNKEWGK